MKGIIAILAAALLTVPTDGIIFGNRTGVNVIGGCTEVGCDYSEDRALNNFTSLSTGGPFNVYYVQSQTSKVVVEGKKEFVEKLDTKVSGGNLQIKLQDGTYKGLVLKVTVYSPVLDGIKISGSGSFIEKGDHKSNGSIDFHLSGSGNLKTNAVECKGFSARISGSGRIEVPSIKGQNLSFAISGSGRITIGTAKADNDVAISISGSGNGDIDNADIGGSLDLRISGSGNINVDGKAGSVVAHTSGSGNIHGNLKYNSIDTQTSGSGRVRFSNN